jgi:hypothetical protein
MKPQPPPLEKIATRGNYFVTYVRFRLMPWCGIYVWNSLN